MRGCCQKGKVILQNRGLSPEKKKFCEIEGEFQKYKKLRKIGGHLRKQKIFAKLVSKVQKSNLNLKRREEACVIFLACAASSSARERLEGGEGAKGKGNCSSRG